jgi:pimeloyl-ACP methyl ester carboxylesterase
MYEAPYNDAPEARRAWGRYIAELTGALAAHRRSDAVALFMKYVGVPADRIDCMRRASTWPVLETLAPTLAYDHTAILGKDQSVPRERASTLTVPTLVMSGGASYPFMRETARTLSQAIPRAELQTLEAQTHDVNLSVLAPVLLEFFSN